MRTHNDAETLSADSATPTPYFSVTFLPSARAVSFVALYYCLGGFVESGGDRAIGICVFGWGIALALEEVAAVGAGDVVASAHCGDGLRGREVR
jgi:hypothetical protein